jgi:hypothetical protein
MPKLDRSPTEPEALGCKITRLTPVDHPTTKIRATFDLSVGGGLITIVDCRLVDRWSDGRPTVYGPSVQRPSTGTYPRFVRFEPRVIEHITALAQAELAKCRKSGSGSDAGGVP